MKLIALLAFCIATLDSSLVFAAECTEDDLIEISNIYSGAMADGTASCPDLTTTAEASDYCSFTECLRLMSSMLDDLPDCTSAGVNIKEGLQAAIDICDGGTAATSDIFPSASSGSTSSTPTTASSSSTPTTGSTSSNSLLQTSTPSTDTTSDKLTGNTIPSAEGSSSASSIGMALSSAVVAMTAFIVGL